MARYRKTDRRNKAHLQPRVRRRPGRLRQRELRRLPWWCDPLVMQILNRPSEGERR
jgi:hypothetical protein